MGLLLDDLLAALWAARGSDLLLTAGVPPLLRVDGELRPLAGQDALTPDDTERLLHDMLSRATGRRLRRPKRVDFSFSWRDHARLRVNGFRQRGASRCRCG